MTLLGTSLLFPTGAKRRVFVSYHHGGDQPYYDAFSRLFHDTYEAIFDNSLERNINSDDVEYICAKSGRTILREPPALSF
jgi:hypothetical protein